MKKRPIILFILGAVAMVGLYFQDEIKERFSPDAAVCEVCESDCPCPEADCDCDDDCGCPACI